jgi:hypothetical protein
MELADMTERATNPDIVAALSRRGASGVQQVYMFQNTYIARTYISHTHIIKT